MLYSNVATIDQTAFLRAWSWAFLALATMSPNTRSRSSELGSVMCTARIRFVSALHRSSALAAPATAAVSSRMSSIFGSFICVIFFTFGRPSGARAPRRQHGLVCAVSPGCLLRWQSTSRILRPDPSPCDTAASSRYPGWSGRNGICIHPPVSGWGACPRFPV